MTPFRVAFAALFFVCATSSLDAAQAPQTIRLQQDAVVMEQPRGDSVRLGTVAAGSEVHVLERRGNWIRIRPASPAGQGWNDGWIRLTTPAAVGAPRGPQRRAPGETMIRAFAHGAGTLFTASDSFDAVLGSRFGLLAGGGAQFVFPNGAFVQGSFERFRKTGSRVLVSGEQLFALDVEDTVTLTPVHLSVGYRAPAAAPVTPYVGAGGGWYTFEEESAFASTDDRRHLSYHVFGGAEFAVSRWVAIAGEVQWTAVPNAIGENGISALFEEEDLGGTTFRFKLIVGR